ncbi:MAG: flavodoxin [Clostridia bacterium]|nr:flavodoxin [Clostridia bacterium]
MKKVAVVYWSGTGNTEAMASAVVEGAEAQGAEAVLLTAAQFDASMLDALDVVAFGCPAMGAEVLEECEFEPMFTACRPRLSGKRIALFGPYGWGDGEWMREWEKACAGAGAMPACDSVMCHESPDDVGLAACRALGSALAS